MSAFKSINVAESDLLNNGKVLTPFGDWSMLSARVRQFVPPRAHELNEFMLMEASGMVWYGWALAEMHEACVIRQGLDPTAMQGIADYSDTVINASNAMTAAHRRFTSRYGDIIEAVDGGVRMPHDGRFFTGEAG
jgi:hypothetical protein